MMIMIMRADGGRANREGPSAGRGPGGTPGGTPAGPKGTRASRVPRLRGRDDDGGKEDGGGRIRILAINGSPHANGNTATLMRWAAEGCQKAGAVVDWLHIAAVDIGYCQGCFFCLRTGRCVRTDDLSSVLTRVDTADGLIVGSPVYEGAPTAQLKCLMDRVALLALYFARFDSKLTLGVATSGLAPCGKTAKAAAGAFGSSVGVLKAHVASLKAGYRTLNEKEWPRLARRARRRGARLVRKLQRWDGGGLRVAYFTFLRTKLLKRIVVNNPEQFAGVIADWEERGWLEAGEGQ